eukprot:CAMPEP_0183759078 /NCGR_PEP_ID=MMETSP0739-20130205/6841_1 /TAXON_ID=385413 /ORGANISM="Thalassiosira miniscula, Strain CCMP1093" /LENGTH=755 /DNA_ID=CAMNT_0025996785 /DNA_START=97 /DNA_END=2364 /DNA_ORIENTATION=+
MSLTRWLFLKLVVLISILASVGISSNFLMFHSDLLLRLFPLNRNGELDLVSAVAVSDASSFGGVSGYNNFKKLRGARREDEIELNQFTELKDKSNEVMSDNQAVKGNEGNQVGTSDDKDAGSKDSAKDIKSNQAQVEAQETTAKQSGTKGIGAKKTEARETKATNKMRRRLMHLALDPFVDPKSVELKSSPHTKTSNKSSDYDKRKQQAQQKQQQQQQASSFSSSSVQKYSLQDALSIFDVYDDSMGLFVYNPKEDDFEVFYSDNIAFEESRFVRVRAWLLHSLRMLMPDRFTPDAPELVIPFASMDYPQMHFEEDDCFASPDEEESCVPSNFPPVLQFGSVFRLPKIPSTIAMPMPEKNHLGCFWDWLDHHKVCKMYTERREDGNKAGLVFGETVGLKWDDLIPQVLSRTSDRGYLTRMNKLRRPVFDEMIQPALEGITDEKEKRVAAVEAMMKVSDNLIPRWKAVAMTAQAELEAEEKGEELPWCNMKFAMTFFMSVDFFKDSGEEDDFYTKFVNHGIPAVGEKMDLQMLAKYKYHMDIGGGGGTTWSGTLEKLALPGVLFHHQTPTKDYNHAKIEPWVHYIPLKEDLSDLREKFDWAESHQKEAREISERATAFIKSLATEEGFGKFSKELYEEPLKRAVNAYQPIASRDGGPSWRELLDKKVVKNHKGEAPLRTFFKCGGHGDLLTDCEDVSGNDILKALEEAKQQRAQFKQKEMEELSRSGGGRGGEGEAAPSERAMKEEVNKASPVKVS